MADVYSAPVWYFAYGSNISFKRMSSRGIIPIETLPVAVPTHILTFDIFGIPYAEPSFASIAQICSCRTGAPISGQFQDGKWTNADSSIPPVHGVAYLLTAKDYRRLIISEGSGVGYNEIEVKAYALYKTAADNTERSLLAKTLVAKFPWRPNRAPSARYRVWTLRCSLPMHPTT